MTDEHIRQLLEQQQVIIDKISKTKAKDGWDKLATLSTFLSTIVIGVIGIYFTYNFKTQEVRIAEAQVRNVEAQLRIAEVQVAERVVPVLSGPNEEAKKGALLTISTLRNKDLAVRLATLYPSVGTIGGLELIYKAAGVEDKETLRGALVEALYNRTQDRNSKYEQIIKDSERIFILETNDEILAKHGDHFLAECYRISAWAYVNIGKYDPALENIRKSLAVIPNYNMAYWTLGFLHWRRSESDQALKYYNLAIENGADPEVYLDLGDLYMDLKDAPKAIAAYGKYISSYRYDFRGYFSTAMAYKDKKDFHSAIRFLSTADNYAIEPNEKTAIEGEIKEINAQMKIRETDNPENVKPTPSNRNDNPAKHARTRRRR